ncbi:MAG: hydrogenase maturation nickel metallochaperone HypA [Acidimicrobiales bacterium]
MHELGLCEAILGAVEKRAGDRPVARVRVRVGRLHHVHPEAFEQSFAIAAMGSVADEAAAELVLLPVRGTCEACGEEFEAEEPVPACPACGGLELDITGGDELVLESIEYRP